LFYIFICFVNFFCKYSCFRFIGYVYFTAPTKVQSEENADPIDGRKLAIDLVPLEKDKEKSVNDLDWIAVPTVNIPVVKGHDDRNLKKKKDMFYHLKHTELQKIWLDASRFLKGQHAQNQGNKNIYETPKG